jgi:hypothetical protein
MKTIRLERKPYALPQRHLSDNLTIGVFAMQDPIQAPGYRGQSLGNEPTA